MSWAGGPSTTHRTSCGVSIIGFGFVPATVTEGSPTTLSATVKNCTMTTFKGSLETFGVLVCVVADPVIQPLRIRPRHTAVVTVSYTAPSCAGTGTITGRLLGRRGVVAHSAEASLVVDAP